jgi:Protein of unknown function (DUF3662)/Inner membrane component of T3SS, cytoplasmic domain
MTPMNEQHLARFESRIESLVEYAFSRVLGNRIHAHDLAIKLARVMEDHLLHDPRQQERPVAPDYYQINLQRGVCSRLLESQPHLPELLSQHLVELASNLDFRLIRTPIVDLQPNDQLEASDVDITARHQGKKRNTTTIMQRVDVPVTVEAPGNPHLLVNGNHSIPLNDDVVNIGRARENQVVLDDPSVSRHHLQLRLNYGRYILFDAQSQGGTLVNNTPVYEHRLQTGDVIQIGNTHLVYIEDPRGTDTETGYMPPVG